MLLLELVVMWQRTGAAYSAKCGDGGVSRCGEWMGVSTGVDGIISDVAGV